MITPLPVRVTPGPNEAMDSYIERVAAANVLAITPFTHHLKRLSGSTLRFLNAAPSPELVATLARLTDTPESALHELTLSRYEVVPEIHNHHRYAARAASAKGWFSLIRTQACPACVGEGQPWASYWRLPWVTACLKHGCLLITRCPGCRVKLRSTRLQGLRAGGFTPLCGNPRATGRVPQCEDDLGTTALTLAGQPVLVQQQVVLAALRGSTVFCHGEPVTGTEYLRRVRSIAVLLFHTVAISTATGLPAWAQKLRAEAQARTKERGPRWGVSAPDCPQSRAAVFLIAHQILTGPVGAGRGSLDVWLDLVPPSNEGTRAWAEDHTTTPDAISYLIG
ncbi:TniQ family protein [Micrococcus luteus]|uniref:TniQ family protein n=1 Tax=Micrococcus TaxID=1269 RepID=UPI0020236654|nr:TniQ family protein [Micrococcus yunnanensis]MCV7508159.1 TniQ family protein [Micrococcus luteus]MCV7533636.1 TniQ family protein [Micrococcus luteus]URI28216.1 TniQ family protein [Micrococcus yunnanensis]